MAGRTTTKAAFGIDANKARVPRDNGLVAQQQLALQRLAAKRCRRRRSGAGFGWRGRKKSQGHESAQQGAGLRSARQGCG